MRGTVNVSVSVYGLVVAACWLIGAAVAVFEAVHHDHYGPVGYVFIATSATLFVVGRLQTMADGWLAAYEAGREVTRLRERSGTTR